MQSKLLALAAVAAVPALATKPAVNVYFGQSGFDSLGSYCESGSFEYVTVAFVNNSPEQDTSGLNYPGTNFGAHCAADVYTKDGKKSNLLSQCTFIAEDITKCQALGKKVLLSVGGAWLPGTNYTVSSVAKGNQFADFLWGAFGPYNPTFAGPRPFDFNGNHVTVDGFDFDIETKFADQSGYISMIKRLRLYFALSGGNYLITGAPQCPLIDDYFDMKDMITKAKFDILFIQFYNNAGCDAIDGNDGPGEHFNYDDWDNFLKGTESKNAKLFIGILGSPGSGKGYLEPEAAEALFEEYKTRPSFGGAMIWDVNTGSQLLPNGKTYVENIHDIVVGPPEPITTSSPPTSTATTEPYPTSTEETIPTTTEETYPTTTEETIPSTTEETYPTTTEESYPTTTEESYPTTTEAEETYPTTTEESYPTTTEAEETYPTTTEDNQPTTSEESYPTTTEESQPTTTEDSYPTTTEDSYPSTTEDSEPTTSEESYPTTTENSYPTTTGESEPTTTEAETSDSYPTETYPAETQTTMSYPEQPTDSYPTAIETSEAYPTETYPASTQTSSTYEEQPTDSYPTSVETSEAYPTSTESSLPTDVYLTASETEPCDDEPTETGTSGPYPTSTSDAYPTETESCTESDVPTTSAGAYPTSAETSDSYPTGTSTSDAYPTGSETCTESDAVPTYTASQSASGEDSYPTEYPVTKEVIATVVPVPSSYEAVTPSGVGNFEVYPTQAFSTVTKYPTQSGGAGNSVPAGTGYPTPTYPGSGNGGYTTSAAEAVSETSPVIAGAGRNAVAFGVPAAMAVAMLVL